MSSELLRRTALFDSHRALGARIVPFGGFEMPVQYASILREHAAVRERAGLFDLSHMAQFTLEGDDVGAWADTLTTNNVATMKPGQARYNIFANERGGAHDDVIFYRLDERRWLLVANAANAAKMWDIVSSAARGSGVTVRNDHGSRALIAIQGPRSVAILQPFCALPLAEMRYYSCAPATVGGIDALVARTGYTGEDGFEVFCDAHVANDLWDALLREGRAAGLEPAGLGARDVLRLEAGMPLYGHELTEEISPLQAGLGWAVKTTKPSFTGKDALAAQREDPALAKIAGLLLDGKIPARSGYRVFFEGADAGEVRSGSIAPAVGGASIATALLAPAAAVPGTRVEVEIRGAKQPASVVALPFYKRAP